MVSRVCWASTMQNDDFVVNHAEDDDFVAASDAPADKKNKIVTGGRT